MLNDSQGLSGSTLLRRLGRVLLLTLLLMLATVSAGWAQEGAPVADTGDRPCAACHPIESQAWAVSPHALAVDPDQGHIPGAACADCHGDYVRGHPDNGLMNLTVDSEVCHDCHFETFTHWEGTIHAEAGVQCIGCHQSHSQTLRLTDDQLCVSCHRDALQDSMHLAHQPSKVSCVNCHMAVDYDSAMAAAAGSPVALAPSHDFVTVLPTNCLNCHREDVYRPVSNTGVAAVRATLEAESHRAYLLSNQLETAQRSNRTLGALSVVTLGVGLGMGAILGIVFVLVMARLERRKEEI